MSGYLSGENENTNLKRFLYPYVHAALFTTAKIYKQPKCPPIDEWLKKIVTYIYDSCLENIQP